jgi:hypothetical protein
LRTYRHLAAKVGTSKGGGKAMANYPQELAQDAVCQSHTSHMTGFWFLPARPLRLNTNEWMNVIHHFWVLSQTKYSTAPCNAAYVPVISFAQKNLEWEKAQRIKLANCVRSSLQNFTHLLLATVFTTNKILIAVQKSHISSCPYVN